MSVDLVSQLKEMGVSEGSAKYALEVGISDAIVLDSPTLTW